MFYKDLTFDMISSLACGREVLGLPAWVAQELIKVPAILTLTGATSSDQTSLVGRTRRFHPYVFDDEQRHDVLKEFLVVLRCERDTILLHDLTQGLEERHKMTSNVRSSALLASEAILFSKYVSSSLRSYSRQQPMRRAMPLPARSHRDM